MLPGVVDEALSQNMVSQTFKTVIHQYWFCTFLLPILVTRLSPKVACTQFIHLSILIIFDKKSLLSCLSVTPEKHGTRGIHLNHQE
jgi:hypothetical protein